MAKRFKFRPEPVLRLRQQAEQAALRRLAEARSRVTGIEQRIGHLRGQLTEQDRLVRQGVLTGTVDVQYMSLYRRHVMALHRRLVDQAVQLRQASVELQQARGQAMEARKRRRVLSTLKDKLLTRHRAERARAAQREMDEVATIRHVHAMAGTEE